jgi:hypothetical protein
MYTKLFNVFYLVIFIITKTLVINTTLFLRRENVFVNFVSICMCVGAYGLAGECQFQVSHFLFYIAVLYPLEKVHQRCKPNILLMYSLCTFLQQELERVAGNIVSHSLLVTVYCPENVLCSRVSQDLALSISRET